MAKQVFDLREGKGMSAGQSTEHLRNYNITDPDMKKYGYYDPTRVKLNFEVGKGGIVMPVNKQYSIVQRFKDNLRNRGIEDPNEIKRKKGLEPNRNTVANIILGGSREQMHKLAYGDQKVDIAKGADNRQIIRHPDIEKWAVDMYNFISKRFGEENIIAFVVHLDEKNPHVHCTVVPVNEKNKISYHDVFGHSKEEARKTFLNLHNDVAEVNKKYDLERGTDINTTGAKHRTSEEYWRELRDSSTVLENKNSNIQKDIKRAEIKIKGLSRMLSNLESEKEDVLKQIDNLSSEESSKREQLEQQLQELESKIQDKADKLNEATEQYQYLQTLNSELRRNNEVLKESNWKLEQKNSELRRELKNELEPQQENKVQDQVSRAMNWYTNNVLKDFYNNNPDIREVMEQHQIYDIATKSEEIAKTATLLFVGRFEDAINYTLTHGGGGGGDNSLKRDDNDDDWSWMVKCIVSARRMMGRGGRKIKR